MVLTLVDAVSGLRNLDKAPEARKQAILADRLVVSKIDLADSRSQKRLAAKLKALNPRADIDMALDGEIDPKHLIDSGQDATSRRSGFIAEAAHSDGIVSFVMREDRPLDWPVFHRAMETLIAIGGYRTRWVNVIDGKKPLGTHAVVEVFYDEGWHLYDPTFGVKFQRKDGQVASYRAVV